MKPKYRAIIAHFLIVEIEDLSIVFDSGIAGTEHGLQLKTLEFQSDFSILEFCFNCFGNRAFHGSFCAADYPTGLITTGITRGIWRSNSS